MKTRTKVILLLMAVAGALFGAVAWQACHDGYYLNGEDE